MWHGWSVWWLIFYVGLVCLLLVGLLIALGFVVLCSGVVISCIGLDGLADFGDCVAGGGCFRVLEFGCWHLVLLVCLVDCCVDCRLLGWVWWLWLRLVC